MDFFEDIPEDWRQTSHTNIKTLIGAEMFKELKYHTTLGKVVQHGAKVYNINQHSMAINFQYKAASDNSNPDIVGEEIDFLFTISRYKTKHTLRVIRYQIYIQSDYGNQIRSYIDEQDTILRSRHLSISRIIRSIYKICDHFVYYKRLRVEGALYNV